MDSEGTPMQELSALEMNFQTREIVDVFHAHAYSPEPDTYARRHIHGLSLDFLRTYGFRKPYQMVDAFKAWLRKKPYLFIYGNDPAREVSELHLVVCDIGLDNWAVRAQKAYHEIAYHFKKHNIPICSMRCTEAAHSNFEYICVRPNNPSDIAKERHGYHCSLYDCYEMYLCYISTS